MFDAFYEVKKLVAEKKSRNEKSGRNEKTEDYDGIYTEAGKRLRPRLSGPVVKKLYEKVKAAVARGEWEPWSVC